MKKFVMIISLFVLSITLAACGSLDNAKNVASVIKKQSVYLEETTMDTYFKLGLDPGKEKAYKTDFNENIFIYVFENEKDRKDGKKQIVSQTSTLDIMHSVSYYETKNILIVHMFVPGGKNSSKNIKEALVQIKK